MKLTGASSSHRFGSVFPSLNMAVKRREQALQDYRRLQAKVEKYEEKEKTGPVLAKLHQAREELRPVREDFEAKNRQLLEEMPRFYGSRLDYFQPSFESLIRAQVRPPGLVDLSRATPCNPHWKGGLVILYPRNGPKGIHSSTRVPGLASRGS
ncbi:Bridging integrator 3 [Saguinus oedipus]|uniref:Bridging integrator 3 n=1 Tax=Saguinus oedipus TaxID=9490 RepID=A0ABQ9U9S4_SAGOE|nr:Bridging integrator 3 [Saguinus oedipus]